MSSLRPGIGIASVPYLMDRQVEGQPHGPGRDLPYENPLLAQISTTTWSADTDVSDEIVAGQTIRTTLTDPDGTAYVTDYVVTAADDTAGTDAAGLALMAQRQAESLNDNSDLNNIVIATYSGAVCTVSWLHPDPRGNWTFAATVIPAVAETTLVTTEATSQSQGGTAVPMARFVARRAPIGNGRRRANLPSASTDVLAGVTWRDPTQSRSSSLLSATTNDYQVGSMMTVRQVGQISVTNVGAAASDGDPVYCVISTSGGDALGEVRGDRDGTADVWTLTPTATNDALYGIVIHFPAWDGMDAITLVPETYVADASATPTEICDGLRASIAALGTQATDLLTTSGTATLVLTGDILGRPFVVTDAAEAGDFASITHTTTAAQYTMLVQGARFDEAVASGAVGKIYLNGN